jgi:hypothetical protein
LNFNSAVADPDPTIPVNIVESVFRLEAAPPAGTVKLVLLVEPFEAAWLRNHV